MLVSFFLQVTKAILPNPPKTPQSDPRLVISPRCKTLSIFSSNEILNHVGHSLITSLQTTVELAHILVGCMYIALALQYISDLSRVFLNYLLLPQVLDLLIAGQTNG